MPMPTFHTQHPTPQVTGARAWQATPIALRPTLRLHVDVPRPTCAQLDTSLPRPNLPPAPRTRHVPRSGLDVFHADFPPTTCPTCRRLAHRHVDVPSLTRRLSTRHLPSRQTYVSFDSSESFARGKFDWQHNPGLRRSCTCKNSATGARFFPGRSFPYYHVLRRGVFINTARAQLTRGVHSAPLHPLSPNTAACTAQRRPITSHARTLSDLPALCASTFRLGTSAPPVLRPTG